MPSFSTLPRFVHDEGALDDVLRFAKLSACPHCRRTGTLVGHGLLRGYDDREPARVVRGRRLLCSARFRRPGCGRTCAVRIAHVIAGFTVRTDTLTTMLTGVVDGYTRRASWRRTDSWLVLRSGYRLWRRLLAAQSAIRSALCRLCAPPDCDHARPVAQLLGHMRAAFGHTDCPLAALQLATQQRLFA